MTSEKAAEAVQGTEEEKAVLKLADSDADGTIPDGDLEDNTAASGEFDNSRSRFISGGSKSEKTDPNHADIYVDVDGKTKLEDSFVGLTKDELLKYADDPYWKRVRLALLILFWVSWCAMLGAAIIIIVVAPKCPPRPKLDWWQTASVEQIVPQSFKDSNADGIGDLQGIHGKLSYLQGTPDSLNVSALWLTSIYAHGGTSDGYDVTNFKAVAPEFGTMEDFTELRVALHKKNVKLIMEFIPNHSSDEHPWFKASQNKEDQYANYYVWHPGFDAGSRPPNDWESVNGGSAWTKDSVRGEYYLHQYGSNLPDLNLRNPDVKVELQDILMFWLMQGVDGFSVHGADRLFECANFTETAATAQDCAQFQPESFQIITQWRELLDEYGMEKDSIKFLMVSASGSQNETAQFYRYNDNDGAHMTVNKELMSIGEACEASCIYDKINTWVSFAEPRKIWSNWKIGCPKTQRVVSRFGDEPAMINAMNMLLTTLPGTSISYYGEEIGMHDLDAAELPAGLSEASIHRTPLQWSPEEFAGFTDGNSTWVPIPSDYTRRNIKSQMAHGAGVTNLEVFRSLIKLREEPSMQWGTLEMGVAENVLFYVRQAKGFPGFLVAINFGPSSSTVDFVSKAPEKASIPAKGKVVATTANFANSGSDYDIGTEADLSNLFLEKAQGVMFKWEKDAV